MQNFVGKTKCIVGYMKVADIFNYYLNKRKEASLIGKINARFFL